MNAAEPLVMLPPGTVVHVDCDDAPPWGVVTARAIPGTSSRTRSCTSSGSATARRPRSRGTC